MTELKEKFLAGETFEEFLGSDKKYSELWEALYKRAALSPDLLARVSQIQQPWHLLVLSEDWCGDSINTLPLIARLIEAAPSIDMRIISRDENPDLMDAHLTGQSRSIPVILLLDDDYVEQDWWGPRPSPLQQWVMEEGLKLPKDDRYKEVRRWYARDHGETALIEVLDMIDAASRTRVEV